MNNTEQSFIKDDGISVDARKMNAVRAYFEWSKSIPRRLFLYLTFSKCP